ncbi:unnamed protein product [Toxocara canis]|uniref:DUF3795 domain-containing protein n=1 Tax=Toxocara canis TaxID=6265 RepID=A0A183UWM9_TOXCA|nr:unnamed protein product [Toxocara canis]
MCGGFAVEDLPNCVYVCGRCPIRILLRSCEAEARALFGQRQADFVECRSQTGDRSWLEIDPNDFYLVVA